MRTNEYVSRVSLTCICLNGSFLMLIEEHTSETWCSTIRKGSLPHGGVGRCQLLKDEDGDLVDQAACMAEKVSYSILQTMELVKRRLSHKSAERRSLFALRQEVPTSCPQPWANVAIIGRGRIGRLRGDEALNKLPEVHVGARGRWGRVRKNREIRVMKAPLFEALDLSSGKGLGNLLTRVFTSDVVLRRADCSEGGVADGALKTIENRQSLNGNHWLSLEDGEVGDDGELRQDDTHLARGAIGRFDLVLLFEVGCEASESDSGRARQTDEQTIMNIDCQRECCPAGGINEMLRYEAQGFLCDGKGKRTRMAKKKRARVG